MLTVKCAKCKKKLFKYYKVGQGKVLKCFFSRMDKDTTIRRDNLILCRCGNIIGAAEEDHIKMKTGTFVYTGTKD